jgi:UDP-glucose 4-epimerase
MQLMHEDDLTELMHLCLRRDTSGVYNAAGKGTIRWSEMAHTMGRRMVRLPAWLLYALTAITWKLRLQSDSPASGLEFIRYRWTADTRKLAQGLGFEPHYSSRDAWEAFARGDEPVATGRAAQG